MAFVSVIESVKGTGRFGHLIILTNLLFLVFVVAGCNMKLSEGSRKKSTNNSVSLAEYLTRDYDKAVRPNCVTGMPLEVYLDLYVESFGNIEEANMEFPVFIYLRQSWKDERIAKLVDSAVNLQRELITKLWSPDAYCYNAKQSNLMLPDTEVHSVVKVEPDGSILYSRSAHIVASCEMDLRDFPIDEQICKLTFGSYALADNDILLKWKKSKIQIANKQMAQFTVGEPILSTTVNSFSIGNFTTLTVSFPFKRRMGYYIIQVYIPCIFLVMLSWIVFWMKPDDSASRLTVGITTILTIVFLLGYTNSTLPKVSYVKGMDWYLMVCFAIIFMSLLECVIVDKLWRMKTKDKEKKNTRNIPPPKCTLKKGGMLSYRYVPGAQIFGPKKSNSCQLYHEDMNQNRNQAEEEDDDQASQMSAQEYNHLNLELNRMGPSSATETCVESGNDHGDYDTSVRCFVKRKSCPLKLSAKVDYTSRILFPLTFTLYNVAYWISYLYGISILPNKL